MLARSAGSGERAMASCLGVRRAWFTSTAGLRLPRAGGRAGSRAGLEPLSPTRDRTRLVREPGSFRGRGRVALGSRLRQV
jgi:hypothetical protein